MTEPRSLGESIANYIGRCDSIADELIALARQIRDTDANVDAMKAIDLGRTVQAFAAIRSAREQITAAAVALGSLKLRAEHPERYPAPVDIDRQHIASCAGCVWCAPIRAHAPEKGLACLCDHCRQLRTIAILAAPGGK